MFRRRHERHLSRRRPTNADAPGQAGHGQCRIKLVGGPRLIHERGPHGMGGGAVHILKLDFVRWAESAMKMYEFLSSAKYVLVKFMVIYCERRMLCASKKCLNFPLPWTPMRKTPNSRFFQWAWRTNFNVLCR